MSKKPVRVAVTGAAGQIGYALLFRIASGEMLGKDQPVILQLLEIPDEKAQKALKGVMMELDDCAFPLLAGMEAHGDPMTAFKDADYALLVGSRPRGPGMERAELLAVNGAIFTAQGKALNAVASRNVKVLVVGNPANTNAYIAMKSAPDLPRKNFTAMLRLDHNRAASQIAAKTGKPVADIEKLTVWGNHSPTMYADYRFATRSSALPWGAKILPFASNKSLRSMPGPRGRAPTSSATSMSLTWVPVLAATCDSARLWSRRSMAVKFSRGRLGALFIAM